jgi:hypothetical protein
MNEKLEYYQLCDECIERGFCKLRPEFTKDTLKKDYWMKDESIRDVVPVDAREVKGLFSKKHFAAAHEAFHVEDYETAILNYQAILEEHQFNITARVCLAICYYYLEDYEKALAHAGRISGDYRWLQNFMLHCENKLQKRKELVIENENQPLNAKVVDAALQSQC